MKLLLLVWMLPIVLLGGCSSTANKPIADDPYYAPILPAPAAKNVVGTGSLFSMATPNSLYADVKARNIGDIIEVILSESTQANKKAANSSSKANNFSLTPPTLFGRAATIAGNPLEMELTQSSDFTGASDADQSNSLSGSISVNVIQVLNNGNLIVRGEKWITLNNGDEFIRLTGMVRPQDISADNQIKSIKIANARIQYSGTGSFADSQQMGWLARFFNGTWWPF